MLVVLLSLGARWAGDYDMTGLGDRIEETIM